MSNKIFFTSDLHFGHARIIELCNRPFSDVTHMNQELVYRWNETVDPVDTVIVLGDLAMGNIGDSLTYAALLNGHKCLVPGNHDRMFSGWKGGPQIFKIGLYETAGFEIWAEDLILPHSNVRLNHFPYSGDSQANDRYLAHRPVRGTEDFLLHGHVHNEWKLDTANRQINVGVDVWDFRPVHAEVIRDVISVL